MSTQEKSIQASSRLKNIFSSKDHGILREAVGGLEETERAVVIMRFWENRTLDEIAEVLGITWREVEKFLSRALEKLKASCLLAPGFSRNEETKSAGDWHLPPVQRVA